MPFAAYPDVSFIIRAVRVLPVVALAASVGGILGGFTVYAIDSALTWQRPDSRAENQAASADQQKTRPVRVVGGTIPDPSAGMSAPPPVPQQNPAQQNPAQLSPQVLTAKPLSAAATLEPQGTTSPQGAKPVRTEKVSALPPPPRADQAPNPAPAQQQPTRWPDALSRARQQASSGAQQQPPAVQPNATQEPSTTKNVERGNSGNERAANTNDEDRATSRHDRRGRRLDARAYDRVYNSYGNARAQEETVGSRYDTERRYGRYSRYRRSREIVPEGEEVDRGQVERGLADRRRGDREQATEISKPRSEPFWGGGAFRRDDRFNDDD
jgi:hypothetical protein